MIYLLDTNIVSDLMRNPAGQVAAGISRVGEDNVFTSILVVSEIRFGLTKRPSTRLSAQFNIIMDGLTALDFTAPADSRYAALRTALERGGKPIGSIDMLIAAHALALDYILVTANTREFSRIDGLKLENWLA